MMTFRQGWMWVRSSLCATLLFRCSWDPLSNCLKSNRRYRLKEDVQRHRLPFPSTLSFPSLCLLPRVGKHTTTCTPSQRPFQPPFGCKVFLPPIVPEWFGRQTFVGATFPQNALLESQFGDTSLGLSVARQLPTKV